MAAQQPEWQVTIDYQGVAPYTAGGQQPVLGAYKFRPILAELEPNKSGDGKNVWITCQVTEAKHDPAMVGVTWRKSVTLPKDGAAGQVKDPKGKTYNEKVEGFLNQYLVCIGWDPVVLKGMGGTRVPLKHSAFISTDKTPREGHAFYEPYEPGDSESNSNTTWLSSQEYAEVLAGTRKINTRTSAKASNAIAASPAGAPAMGLGDDPPPPDTSRNGVSPPTAASAAASLLE